MNDDVAFAATDSVESLHAIQSGSLVDLSIMEVHDCCTKGGRVCFLIINKFKCVQQTNQPNMQDNQNSDHMSIKDFSACKMH